MSQKRGRKAQCSQSRSWDWFLSGCRTTNAKYRLLEKPERLWRSPSAQLCWSTFLKPVGHAHVYVLLLGRQRWLQPPLLLPQRFLPPVGESNNGSSQRLAAPNSANPSSNFHISSDESANIWERARLPLAHVRLFNDSLSQKQLSGIKTHVGGSQSRTRMKIAIKSERRREQLKHVNTTYLGDKSETESI